MNEEIGLKDIYEKLIRLETKMDANTDLGKDHESRLRKLETFKNKAVGVLAAFNGVSVLVEWYLWAHK